VGLIGDDIFGREILKIILEHVGVDYSGIVVRKGASTSYTVVINPPGIDRIFLHFPGANDLFGYEDMRWHDIDRVRHLRFGYPPLMLRMFADEGRELERIMARAGEAGVTTSLDMARPDPESSAGRTPWARILKRVLPKVDLFFPSIDELLYMLRPEFFEEVTSPRDLDPALILELLDSCISKGAGIVAVKLGEDGLLVRVTDSIEQLRKGGRAIPECMYEDTGALLYAPCFKVKVQVLPARGIAPLQGF
jgi:sugar/nucleoside kinase (ribokinase family)